jgi:hypothetical protein
VSTPAIPRGNPGAIALGPGYLYVGFLDADEPTDLTTPWEDVDPTWILLGYTETGSEFNYALTSGNVEVAEELDPVMISTTGRTSTVTFTMAEMTASNLSFAMNGGIIHYPLEGVNSKGDPIEPPYDAYSEDVVIVEPPDLGSEVRVMMGFESEDHTERWVMRQCFQTGTMKIMRQKGTTIAGIAAVFSLEKPATSKRLFAAIFNRSGMGPPRLGWATPPAPLPPAAPTVTQCTPAGGDGSAVIAGVQITGTGLTGATAVTFGGTAATAVVVNSATQITCTAPAHAAGAVDVAVTTPAGTGTGTGVFTYALVTASAAAGIGSGAAGAPDPGVSSVASPGPASPAAGAATAGDPTIQTG